MTNYTLGGNFERSGVGLHSGILTTVRVLPAAVGEGRYFVRVDLPGMPVVPARVEAVRDTVLSTELGTLLNGGLSSVTGPSAISHTNQAQNLPSGATDLVHLSLGPVNLNLLGLNVTLDNCKNGPAVVDVSTVPGSGELLGNLLGGVAHLLDPSGTNTLGEQALGRIVNNVLTIV